MRRFEELSYLFVSSRSRDECFQAVRAEALYEVARAFERAKTRKMSPLKNLRVTLDEFFSFVAVVTDSNCLRKELVGSHPNERSHDVKRHVIASFRERFHPGEGVRVIAVQERAVDIEDYAF